MISVALQDVMATMEQMQISMQQMQRSMQQMQISMEETRLVDRKSINIGPEIDQEVET